MHRKRHASKDTSDYTKSEGSPPSSSHATRFDKFIASNLYIVVNIDKRVRLQKYIYISIPFQIAITIDSHRWGAGEVQEQVCLLCWRHHVAAKIFSFIFSTNFNSYFNFNLNPDLHFIFQINVTTGFQSLVSTHLTSAGHHPPSANCTQIPVSNGSANHFTGPKLTGAMNAAHNTRKVLHFVDILISLFTLVAFTTIE